MAKVVYISVYRQTLLDFFPFYFSRAFIKLTEDFDVSSYRPRPMTHIPDDIFSSEEMAQSSREKERER